jgi:hypothetical protein
MIAAGRGRQAGEAARAAGDGTGAQPRSKPAGRRTAAESMNKDISPVLKFAFPVVALALLAVHLHNSKLPVDTTAIVLLILAFLPWLSVFLDSFELFGLKANFRKIEEEQQRQQKDLEYVQFLIANFLTKWEDIHLRKIAQAAEYIVDVQSDTYSSFEKEIDHLRQLGLINNYPEVGLRTMRRRGGKVNVKEFFHITSRGRDYLKLRDAAPAPPEDQEDETT